MKSEIGSNFWLTPSDVIGNGEMCIPDYFNCKGSDYVWLSSGRSAISFIIKTIEERNPNINKVVCLPSFTCHTVFEPFVNAGYDVKTLPVDRNLNMSIDDILTIVKKTKAGVVLLHNYFGFETIPNFKAIHSTLKSLNVVIIEDCTQSMYSNITRIEADYYVGSIRKWCGVPDGGFAVCNSGQFIDKPLEFDHKLQAAKKYASELKYSYLFDSKGEKKVFLAAYRIAEDILSNQKRTYAISNLSKVVLSNLDIEEMKRCRKANFKYLLYRITDIKYITPIFKKLNDNETPLYFPIICNNRSKIQKILVENSIYAPIVWPKDPACPSVSMDADFLYEQLLCIPIDQRYDIDDMDRIISVLHEIQ